MKNSALYSPVAETSLVEPTPRLTRVHPGVTQDIGASYLSPSNRAARLNMQFVELEGPTFHYLPMFSQDSAKMVNYLTHWPLKICAPHMNLDLTDDNSTLVQVMVWCLMAPSHFLSQCWPRSIWKNKSRSLWLYGITRPHWVKWLILKHNLVIDLLNTSCKSPWGQCHRKWSITSQY